jgi:hypothetical protein
MVSLPYYIQESPETLLAGIIGNLNTVYAYNACADPGEGWSNFATSGPPGTLAEIRHGKGYWFLMNDAATLQVTGSLNPEAPALPPTYTVCEGWNLLGFKRDASALASDYLSGVNFGAIYTYADGLYYLVQGDEFLMPGYSYWVAVITGPGTIYP